MPNLMTIGTSGGNKDVTEPYIGTSGGNKLATEVWIGTASGNKLVFPDLIAISWSGFAWISINIVSPATTGTTAARTATFTGPTRTISAAGANNGVLYTLEYEISSGGWITYTVPFSLSTGQTLGWRLTGASGSFSETITVTDVTFGATTGSIAVSR